jgi:hypothetical protein
MNTSRILAATSVVTFGAVLAMACGDRHEPARTGERIDESIQQSYEPVAGDYEPWPEPDEPLPEPEPEPEPDDPDEDDEDEYPYQPNPGLF